MIVKCILALVVLFSAACGRVLEGPQMSEVYSSLSAPSPGSSRLYFLRPGEKAYLAKARIDIDGDRVIELPLSGCYYQEVAPGTRLLYLDIPADMGSHEMTIDVAPQSSRYFKIWPRSSRKWSWLLGFIGTTANYFLSDSKNDGSLEFIELSRKEAVPLFTECVFFDEKP